jgi:hypothetical protein
MMDAGATSLACITAFHFEDYDAIPAVMESLTDDELVGLVLQLAGIISNDWSILCERLGMEWSDFIREAGLGLAAKETP